MKRLIIFFVLVLVLMINFISAAPFISDMNGNVEDGQSVVISGSSFGTRPDNSAGGDGKGGLAFAWENFEGAAPNINVWDKSNGGGGPLGITDIGLNKANSTKCVEFERFATGQAYTDIFGRSWSSSLTQFGMGVSFIAGANPPGLQQVGYMSGWFMVPSGWYSAFEADQTDGAADQIKFLGFTSWQSDSAEGPKTYLNPLEQASQAVIHTIAEDTTINNPKPMQALMPEGTWHRLEVMFDTTKGEGLKLRLYYIDGKKIPGPISGVPTDYYIEGVGDPEICGGYECPRYFQWAWLGTVIQYITNDDPWPTYADDFYIDLSWARVEICNTSTWDSITPKHCEIQIPTIWSDGSITINVNQGSFNDGEQAYLFVVDENGIVSNGYGPITLGDGLSNCGDADADEGGSVSITELINYISQWKAGSVVIGELITAIGEWKNGCS